jgi:hypothetical protein
MRGDDQISGSFSAAEIARSRSIRSPRRGLREIAKAALKSLERVRHAEGNGSAVAITWGQ